MKTLPPTSPSGRQRSSRAGRTEPLLPASRRRAGLLRRHPFRTAGVVILLLLSPVAWSYGRAITRPGTDSLGVRSVEWIRDHGGSRLVAWVETEWYSHHQPPKGGLPKHLPSAAPVATAPPKSPAQPVCTAPAPAHLLVNTPLLGEGQWVPTGRIAGGCPALYTTFMRPDAVHTSLVTGVARLDSSRLRFELWSGNQEPGGGGWTLQAPIPVPVRSQLVAAFNSAFKLSDSRGGYYAEGHLVKALVPGRASMVFHADGRLDVGLWGRDFNMSPDIVGVRQNLQLLIDHGQPAPGLDHASEALWGFTVANRVLVWRSGVGVDAQGNVIYAAGNGLSVQTLANVLLAAGAVRAMELDINSAWTHFYSYHNDPTVLGGTAGTKLIPDMTQPTDKYFRPSSRDFVAVFERTGA